MLLGGRQWWSRRRRRHMSILRLLLMHHRRRRGHILALTRALGVVRRIGGRHVVGMGVGSASRRQRSGIRIRRKSVRMGSQE